MSWLVSSLKPSAPKFCGDLLAVPTLKMTQRRMDTRDDAHFFVVYRGTADSHDAAQDVSIQMVPTKNGALPFLDENNDLDELTPAERSRYRVSDDDDDDDDDACCATTMACMRSFFGLKKGEIWLHSGFTKCIASVVIQIDRKVKELNTGNLPVVLTGHSLGGALAVLNAFIMSTSVDAVYTFGQPRPELQSRLRRKKQGRAPKKDVPRRAQQRPHCAPARRHWLCARGPLCHSSVARWDLDLPRGCCGCGCGLPTLSTKDHQTDRYIDDCAMILSSAGKGSWVQAVRDKIKSRKDAVEKEQESDAQ